MAIELNDDTLYTSAIPSTGRVFGALSAGAAEPTSFGREAIINTASAGLAAVASSGSATDLTSGTLPLQRLHAFLQDIANISFSNGDIMYFDGTDLVRIPIGSADQALQVFGGIPAWRTIPSIGASAAADAASASAAAAASSASAASTSASNASTSASSASTSASTATTQASSATSSASSASTSASTATTQASNASTSASNAATSASNASTSATNASNSASAASTSASNAATSETNAATSASTASTQASNASSSASNAATSAANAAAAAGFTWTFSSTTTMADPGTGGMRFNHATFASITAIAVSTLTADSGNPDVSARLLARDDSTNTNKGTLLIRKGTSVYREFTITALTDNTTWVQYTVIPVATGGSLTNGDTVIDSYTRNGDKGTLDDYEESTWTPVLTFATPGDLSVTYSTQAGNYTKVGRVVYWNAAIVTSAFTWTTASGAANITGLSVVGTSINTSGLFYNGIGSFTGITKATHSQFLPRLQNNTATIDIVANGSGVSAAAIVASDVPSGGTISFKMSGWYFV